MDDLGDNMIVKHVQYLFPTILRWDNKQASSSPPLDSNLNVNLCHAARRAQMSSFTRLIKGVLKD